MSATTIATPTLVDAIAYINQADDDGVARIIDAIKARQRSLQAERAATVVGGMTATLTGLSPKYLNGLSGTVTAIDGKRATVELDEASTNTLRYTRQTRYPIPFDQARRTIKGIPLACIQAK